MKTGIKIAIGAGVLTILGVGGYFTYRSIKKGKEAAAFADNEAKRIAAEQDVARKQAEVDALTTTTAAPKIDTMFNTLPPIPDNFLGGMGLGSTVSQDPTTEEYIRMGDGWFKTWEDAWLFAAKLGISDKTKVGGIDANDTNAIVNNTSRKAFGEIVAKYPNWKTLIKAKIKEFGIPVVSDAQFALNRGKLKTWYGFEMAQFDGGTNGREEFKWR